MSINQATALKENQAVGQKTEQPLLGLGLVRTLLLTGRWEGRQGQDKPETGSPGPLEPVLQQAESGQMQYCRAGREQDPTAKGKTGRMKTGRKDV